MSDRAPITQELAAYISGYSPASLPADVMSYTQILARDGIGVLCAATHHSVTGRTGHRGFCRIRCGKWPLHPDWPWSQG